jgi:hypothetical protein
LSWEAKEGEIQPSGDNTAFYTVPKEGRFWVSVSDETGKKEIALIDATQPHPIQFHQQTLLRKKPT